MGREGEDTHGENTHGAIATEMMQHGNVDTRNIGDLPRVGRRNWHDPAATRGQEHEAMGVLPTDADVQRPGGHDRLCDQAQGSNRTFDGQYRTVAGHNRHFDFPITGSHEWSTWTSQTRR